MDLRESAKLSGDVKTRHPWELARIEVVKRVLREMAPLQAGDIVLDIGCGDGFMVDQVALSYPAVTFYGIDIAFDEPQLDALKQRLKAANVRLFRTLEGAASEIAHRTAAVVLLMDVLEHIDDETVFLRRIQELPIVDPATQYVVSVPAFDFLFSIHDDVLGHYRRYSKETLERVLEQAGLKPRLVCYFFVSLLVPRLVQTAKDRLLRRRARRPTQTPVWRGGVTLQHVFKTLLIWDFSVSWLLARRGITLPGLSNLAVCRKPA